MNLKSNRMCDLILGLTAVAAALVCALKSAGALSDSSGLIFSLVFLLLWLVCALLLIRWPLFPQPRHTVCALAGLYLCLCLRLSLFDHISPDYVSFLSQWVSAMRDMTLREALATPIGDYNMPYLYLLLLISRLPFYDLYCIKLASVLADVFLAAAMVRLAGLVTRRSGVLLAVFFTVLLAPTTFLNSAYWGQCDSIYVAFALWGLYFGLNGRPKLSMVMLALAFAFKLQTVFLLPIVAFLLVRQKISLRQLPVFPAVFLAAMLPALLAGRSVSDTFGIYLDQADAYPYLSLNAPSFWSLIPNEYFDELEPAPLILAGIVTLLLLYVFLTRWRSLTTGDLLTVSLIFCLAIPWLLPRMHERYFYLAEMLSILYAVQYPRRLPVAGVLLGGGFLAYSVYLFGQMPILSNGLVAACYGATLAYLTLTLLRRTDCAAPKKTGAETHGFP